MLIARNRARVRLPEIAEAFRSFVPPRNFSPQRLAGLGTPIPSNEGHNLFRDRAECNPNPTLVFLIMHERPEFIQLERALTGSWWHEGAV